MKKLIIALTSTAAIAVPVGFVSADDADLSDAEIDALTFMREEEKLAHDVYVTLGDLWGLPVFDNIASSETKHTEEIRDLLADYGIADPVVDDTVGVFVNADLSALYDQLVARGSESVEAALEVGALIEDLDIVDLQQRAAETDESDILKVFASLEAASGNHLRSFAGQLDRYGVEYQPSYLTDAEYEAILAGSGGSGEKGAGNGERGSGAEGRGEGGGSSAGSQGRGQGEAAGSESGDHGSESGGSGNHGDDESHGDGDCDEEAGAVVGEESHGESGNGGESGNRGDSGNSNSNSNAGNGSAGNGNGGRGGR